MCVDTTSFTFFCHFFLVAKDRGSCPPRLKVVQYVGLVCVCAAHSTSASLHTRICCHRNAFPAHHHDFTFATSLIPCYFLLSSSCVVACSVWLTLTLWQMSHNTSYTRSESTRRMCTRSSPRLAMAARRGCVFLLAAARKVPCDTVHHSLSSLSPPGVLPFSLRPFHH